MNDKMRQYLLEQRKDQKRLFQLRTADLRRLGIIRVQKQFEEQEAEKVRQWLLTGGAALLIGAGTPSQAPERDK